MTTETADTATLKDSLLEAALMHVAFDGWTEATFRAAVADSGIDPVLARAICPRGAVDLAVAFHKQGDQAMLDRMAAEDLSLLRYSERVTAAVRFRLEAVADREAVRRGTTLFSLPQHAAEGAALIWGTADAIWTALGDSSDDVNWYTKRATLSGVYGATVLYWLGDDSPGYEKTWEFLERRIDGVMRFEKFKGAVRGNPLMKPFLAGPDWLLGRIHAPKPAGEGMPGHWSGDRTE